MFRQRLPDVHILTRETNTREQIVPLSEGALDLGLLRNTQLPDTLAWERVLREPLLAMVPANHPWPASPRSAWRRWRASPSSFSTCTSALACMTTSSAAAPLRPHAEDCPGGGGGNDDYWSGGRRPGVSILPASFQRVQLSEMRWLPIDEQDAVSEMWLVWSKHHEQGALAKRFREALLSWKSEHN